MVMYFKRVTMKKIHSTDNFNVESEETIDDDEVIVTNDDCMKQLISEADVETESFVVYESDPEYGWVSSSIAVVTRESLDRIKEQIPIIIDGNWENWQVEKLQKLKSMIDKHLTSPLENEFFIFE